MADGEVKINTKLDTSGVDKGVKDLKTKLNDAGKTIDEAGKKSKNLDTSLGGMNKTALATAGAVGGIAVAVKKTVDALNDCEAAYKVQRNAEIALQQAAKNNPYLNNESVYNLRNFASELQSMSNIGDEVSIKVMSQLAATGRTESQIMQIMKAAADMAAVTGEDIASAATKLNATLNGNAGMLGRQITSINNLTKEELEAGRAIEIVAQQYNGSAVAMADNTVQLANTWGDFKENIGRGWSRVTAPVKKFFTDILNDMNEALGKSAELEDANAAREGGTANAAQTKKLLDAAQARVDTLQQQINDTMNLLNDEEALAKKTQDSRGFVTKSTFQQTLKKLQSQYEDETKTVNALTTEYNELSAAEKSAADAAAAQATEAEKLAAIQKRDKDATDFIDKNKKALAEQLAAIQLRAELETKEGEKLDETAIAQDMYNAYLQSYIDLVTKSNGLVTENNTAAKERLTLLEQWAQKAQEAADAEKSLADKKKAQEEADALLVKAAGMGDTSIYDKYLSRNAELLKLKEELNAAEIEDEKKKADAIENIDEEMAKNRRELWANVASEVTGYAQQVQGMIDDAAKMALETSNNQMKTELANLEIKYRKGELGEEEYQKKVEEAKKKGAKIQYQIEMSQWASNILMATANTAVGVTQALAQGGVAGIITGALVGAAGAVQLASIMAAKPIQHFATGGYVGGMSGATMGGDNTVIAARGGELVMNANQQRALWDMLNGSGNAAGAGGVNLTINNSAANMVNAQPQISRNEIEIMIDARVNDSLRNGRYNSGLNAAQAGMSGEFYGM